MRKARRALARPIGCIAAVVGQLDSAGLAGASGARVNDEDDYGGTALYWAAHNGHVEAVRALLEAGADARKAGPMGTPLQVAQSGPAEVTELLRAAGAK